MERMIICKSCGEKKPLFAKGLCRSCYDKQNPRIKKICKNCGELRQHEAFDLCRECYNKQKPKIKCKICGKLRQHAGYGLCGTCYSHVKGLKTPMSKNKSCSSYLGVHINEQLLSKIFRDVKQMLPNNPGFDFTCNKGMKIDAKSSVTRISKVGTKSWHFHINKNKIADYFFCVAYTSREDPKPLHMWLIPGEDVNNKMGITISETTLYKWYKYEQSVNKALSCCAKMKKN